MILKLRPKRCPHILHKMEPYVADPQTRRRKIDCKPELIITSLQRFYASNPDISKVMPYFLGTSTLSLRIIDWFVTKFCRKNFTHYPLDGKDFIVYRSYKSQLKAYSKQYFDPNCRRERIMFKIAEHEPFTTTIGQLNFFRWALECKVLDYIEANQETIRTGYNSFLKETTAIQKKQKAETQSSTMSSVLSTISAESNESGEPQSSSGPARITRRRRTKQTPSALRQLQISSNPITLDFN
jgi:hypothetical protein